MQMKMTSRRKSYPSSSSQDFNKLQVKDHLTRIFKLVTDNLEGELKTLVLNKTFIAGGAIRSMLLGVPINDYDFYFTDQVSANAAKALIQAAANETGGPFSNRDKLHFHFKSLTDNALTFTLNVDDSTQVNIQLITLYAGTPDHVISKFDFTNSMAYFIPQLDLLNIPYEMDLSIRRKELVFNDDCLNPAFSLKRYQRFTAEGWQMDTPEVFKMCQKIVGDTKNAQAVLTGFGFYSDSI